jgi:zinc protease
MKYQYAMGLDNPGRIAASLCHYIELTGDPESVNRIYALYEKVSPEDIMAAAKKYFTDNNRTTLVLTHEEVKQ